MIAAQEVLDLMIHRDGNESELEYIDLP